MGLIKYGLAMVITIVAMKLQPQLTRPQIPINIGGRVEAGFEEVETLFRAEVEKQPHKGMAFAAYHEGRLVVDLWGGYADPDIEQPWEENTMTVVFSATKGVAATCVAMLVDRGLLDYDKPVAQYWPEFAQNGKGKITVRQLMSHTGGLPLITPPVNITTMKDHDELGKVLAAEKPLWEPGTAFGYHAFTFGLYVSQLIRRVDPKKRTVGKFISEELRDKYGIDFYVGLPLEENYRVARLIALPPLQSVIDQIMHRTGIYRSLLWSQMFPPDKRFTLKTIFENPEDFNKFHRWNNPEYRTVEQASALGYGTARSLAKLYGILANGGKINGNTLLSEKLIRDLNKLYTKGKCTVFGFPATMGLGFTVTKSPEGQNTFGHPGFGGRMACADPYRKLGISYVSNFDTIYGFGDDPTYMSLRQAVYNSLRK